jgi:3-oxoacyl-[acyl-carrier-protein] synthase III
VVSGGDLDVGCPPFVLGCTGEHGDLLYAERDERRIRMSGPEVFRHAVPLMTSAVGDALQRAGVRAEDLDLLVCHQANARIIDAVTHELGLDPERVVCNIERYANTSSASIPLALWEADRDGRLRPGALVGLVALGAGFVWGAGVVSWKERVHVCA